MNILLINQYAGSPQLGMEYRPYYMAREWQNKGHKVLIISASYSHVRTKQFELIKDFENYKIEGINYLVLKTPAYKGNGIKRVINIYKFVRKLVKYSKKISNEFNPDVVIASSTHPLDIYPAKKVAERSGAKLIFEVHDLWPLAPMELGGYSKWNPFILILQFAENYAYRHSSKVVSIWPKALVYMIQHGLKRDKFIYIPNGIVVEEWDTMKSLPDDINILFKKLKEQKKIILGYAGSHGLSNALDSLIDAMKILEEYNVALVLVGDGPEKENLKLKTQNLGLSSTYFLSPVSKNLIPSLLDKIDILFIGLKNQPLFKYGLCPNKLIDYMMAGKPIIQSYKAGIDMVSDAECGLTIEPENPEAIVNAVRNLISQSTEKLKEMGEKGKKYCMMNHDYKIISGNFLNVLTNN